MKKLQGIKCNKCRDVLYTTKMCACKSLGLKLDGRLFIIYSDDEDITLGDVYIDDTNRLVRFIESRAFDVAPIMFVKDELVDNI